MSENIATKKVSFDFQAVADSDKKIIDFTADVTIEDLKKYTNESIDYLLSLVSDLTDADVTFDPIDEEAHDPHAKEGEENIGWSIAHLIAHVTSSSEEGAAFSSILARGYALRERPRYETPWEDIKTQAHVIQRLEESRRMRLAYLDTWPDEPFLDILRVAPSERFQEYFGDLNAPASFLMGLGHEVGHFEQIEEVRRQALEARS